MDYNVKINKTLKLCYWAHDVLDKYKTKLISKRDKNLKFIRKIKNAN